MKISKSAVIASVTAQGNLTVVEEVLAVGCDIYGEEPNAFKGRGRTYERMFAKLS